MSSGRGGRIARRVVQVLAGVAAGALLASAIDAWLPSVATASNPIPTATAFDGIPSVGAIFLDGTAADHGCTGSVVHGRGRDLVLVAAHCVSDTGRGVLFAPGYRDGEAPFGVWSVSAAYVDRRWVSNQDPEYDYAFLAVDPQTRDGRAVHLGDVVNGYRLRTAPAPGTSITVVAYPVGIDDRPITCTTQVYFSAGYPTFDCHGYVGGTSGAPWLVNRGREVMVTGVIGGPHQGGCFEYTSYSPRFDRDTLAVLRRAESHATPDVLPAPGDDGC